ncbi:MAG: tetratricopeptide repeat-containing sensor histidine kinase [Chitinophagaceae bacterium]|nr:tetratricopeptide repeat-containing sensor histidine kinase [Chitinophagaceae bacterium]
MTYSYLSQPFRMSVYILMILWIITLTQLSCKQNAKNIAAAGHVVRADKIISYADSLQASADFGIFIAYIDSAYRSFPEASPIDYWKKYQYIAKHYLDNNLETAKARLYTDSMAFALKGQEQRHKEAYVQTLFAQGDVLMAEKKYLEAFNIYYDGYNYAKKNLDSCRLAPFTGQLAMIKYWQIHFRQAIPYFLEALKESACCKTQDDFEHGFVLSQRWLNTLALCYQMSGRMDSSLFYLKEALVLVHRQKARSHQNKVVIEAALGTVYGNLGDVYQSTGQYDSSRYYLHECIRINDRPGYNIVSANLSKVLLEFINIDSDKPLSTGIFNQSEDSLKAIKAHETDKSILMQTWYQLKYAYYRNVHYIDSAFFYQTKLYRYVDSMRALQRDLRLADMESIFAGKDMEYRLSLLERDHRIRKDSLLFAIISGLMLSVILLIVWRNLKRSRKNIAELSRLNLQVSQQNDHMQHALCSLEQSHADNTRIMKIVAHDLRNPIGAIKMAASLILSEPATFDEDKKMLNIIIRSADSSLGLVDDLLTTQTRLEEIKKEPVDLQAMLHYCADLLKHKAVAKEQHIELITLPVILPGSRERLWRVISNLIANAIKFSPVGAAIHVSMEKNEQAVRIAVRDNGIGIPEEMKSKIFDMFTEAKRPGTAGERPFGLGLSISKQIVEAHGGSIWFESKPGNGTTFWVELPGNE